MNFPQEEKKKINYSSEVILKVGNFRFSPRRHTGEKKVVNPSRNGRKIITEKKKGKKNFIHRAFKIIKIYHACEAE